MSTMESSSIQTKEIYKPKRNCYGLGHKNAAIIVGFLTLANGAVALVAGVEGLLYGSTLVNDQHVLQTIAGSVIVFSALILLVILFSRLKNSRVALLSLSPVYTLVPFFVMVFLAIFSSVARSNTTSRFIITNACEGGIRKSIFKNITVNDLKAACLEDYLYNLFDQMMWSLIRSAFQLLFSVIMALWTYWQVKELDHCQSIKAITRYRRDIRIIHVPMETVQINRAGPEIDLEQGISSQVHGTPIDEVPPYESIVNTPKDV